MRFKNKIGKEYDLFKMACPHFDRVQLLTAMELSKNVKKTNENLLNVVEIGCGTGETTRHLIEQVPHMALLAIDNEMTMMKQAQDNFADEGVQFLYMNADNALSRLKPNSVDAVASAFTLHNIALLTRHRILKHIFRVLKPGGVFVNGDKYSDPNPEVHEQNLVWQLSQFVDVFYPSGNSELGDQWIKHYWEDNHPNLVMPEDIAIRRMTHIGFRDIEVAYRKRMEAVIVAKKPFELAKQ